MTLKRSLTVVVIVCIALAFVACKKSPEPADGGTGPVAAPKSPGGAAKAKWVIGMSQCNLNEPWRLRMNDDIRAAAAEHPEITIQFKDAQNLTEVQQTQVKEFITQGVDLIIISPKEAVPLTKPVEEAMDAGIPVIVLDRDLAGDKYTCFIGGDNVMIGREAGKYIVELLGGKGKVVELRGLETTVPAHDRHNGFIEGIAGSDIEIIYEQDCQWLEERAIEAMNTALSRFDQIDAVYGHNDPSAHGAYLAAKQEGKDREKTIRFIGIDGNPDEGQQYVKDGILAATLDYQTGGREAIDVALKILNGEEVPKRIVLGTILFTPDNIDEGGKVIPAPGVADEEPELEVDAAPTDEPIDEAEPEGESE